MKVLCALLLATMALAAPGYEWPPSPGRHGTIEERFAPPPGATRAPLAADSFGAWLRRLPLLPDGAPVLLFDGSRKPRQDVHAAVVDIDVGTRDLQQCADAVMRLRAEYLRARRQPVVFHPDPGKPRELRWNGSGSFARFLVRLFADAGTASLAAELRPVKTGAIQPGDVLIQGGYPGHAVLVLDAADGGGRRWLLLGQSYMPAQSFHVLKNPAGGVWYDAAALDGAGLETPEWRPFFRRDVRRF
jgi:Domain of unknown function (4846)